jgi:hypothetical protein
VAHRRAHEIDGRYNVVATARLKSQKKVSIMTWRRLMPTSEAPSRFCAMAMMVEPITVFSKQLQSTTAERARNDQQAAFAPATIPPTSPTTCGVCMR